MRFYPKVKGYIFALVNDEEISKDLAQDIFVYIWEHRDRLLEIDKIEAYIFRSPFPGMKKEASIYVHPADLKVAKGDVLPIKVRASMATKTIEKIDLYLGNDLIATMTEAPYLTEYAVPCPVRYKTICKKELIITDGRQLFRQDSAP